jgi:tRNA (pseudouridine54-N1)-methyltransferase
MKAGRMDIACNVIIDTLFLSHAIRKDAKLHLIFDGPPYAPVHLLFDTTEEGDEIPLSKKDVAGLIKRMLYKCSKEQGKVVKVFPGCFVEKKSFEALVKELDKEGKNVFILNKGGQDLRGLKLKGNEVFIIGDQDGFPPEKKKFLKNIDSVSVGPLIYFASQTITILNNEIDRQST